MDAKTKAKVVKVCTHDWYEIVTRDGELELSEDTFPAGWEQAASEAGLEVEDSECWVEKVIGVAERHTAISPGDYCCCQGYGSDVIFVRLPH